ILFPLASPISAMQKIQISHCVIVTKIPLESCRSQEVAEIYEALKYKQQLFKRRKICSTQTHPPDSIFTCLAMSSG
ncbi:MAG TPA: hypothetical protein PLW20_05330, partial [Paludibacteraceae bacterium]|nr:hypothetical protein [Paludibacteraceae bacterium]